MLNVSEAPDTPNKEEY